MRYSLIILLTFLGTSALAIASFIDVSLEANVYYRALTADAAPGDWIGPGTAAADYDNDGCWLDIFVVGDGELPNALYLNNGDGTFTDVAAEAGVANTPNGRGCVWFDYNNDGWRDLYVTCAGPNYLFKNNGDCTFTDVSEQAGITDEQHGSSAVVADYDHDGWPDIYIANWAPATPLIDQQPPTKTNVLYRNRGDGTFENVTHIAGVTHDGTARSAIFFDYNSDTWQDLFVANDGPDKLYRNRGDGTFADVSSSSGIVTQSNGQPTSTVGLCVADYDNDTDLDLFATSYNTDRLWRNNGNGTFTNVAETLGIVNRNVGGYASFVDYDSDGYRDLYIVNGNTDDSQKTNRNRFYRNQNGTFVDQTEALNAAVDAIGRGGTAGDFDNDGDIDFYIVNNTHNTLLQNHTKTENQRLKIRLRGTRSNRDGIGTHVTVTAGTHVQTQELICGTGFLGSDSLELEFGIPLGHQSGTITLRWPSGIVETYQQFSFYGDVYIFTEAEKLTVAVEPIGKQPTLWGRVKSAHILQNYPNPFNPETWIPYQLFEPADVHIAIYSQNGEKVRNFNLGYQSSGEKTFYWDGKNQNGEPVASGTYFYQFRVGNTYSVRKMSLIK